MDDFPARFCFLPKLIEIASLLNRKTVSFVLFSLSQPTNSRRNSLYSLLSIFSLLHMEDFEQMLQESSGEIIEISTSQPDAEMPEWRSDLPEVIPVMPLRGVVLFPGTVAPLTVERAASKKLLEELLPTGRLLALTTQMDAELDTPKKDDVYSIGVARECASDGPSK